MIKLWGLAVATVKETHGITLSQSSLSIEPHPSSEQFLQTYVQEFAEKIEFMSWVVKHLFIYGRGLSPESYMKPNVYHKCYNL